jgi:hypothetical protein
MNGLAETPQQFSTRVPLRRTTKNIGDLRPIAAFFRLVYDDLHLHFSLEFREIPFCRPAYSLNNSSRTS